MNVTFAIASPAIEPSGRTDCTIERIGSGTNDLTVDGRNFTQSWGRKGRVNFVDKKGVVSRIRARQIFHEERDDSPSHSN